eukprot:TRINITY_DN20115_c0_g1_i3.p1 TRINITY_DN20115_c0_g1~~TRINITY_DN20115_c0_g1_i3.p1  ORF type:complete len:236 (-),score=36.16 TRINITY_DN20115_c0_g1_i3:59-706(-)
MCIRDSYKELSSLKSTSLKMEMFRSQYLQLRQGTFEIINAQDYRTAEFSDITQFHAFFFENPDAVIKDIRFKEFVNGVDAIIAGRVFLEFLKIDVEFSYMTLDSVEKYEMYFENLEGGSKRIEFPDVESMVRFIRRFRQEATELLFPRESEKLVVASFGSLLIQKICVPARYKNSLYSPSWDVGSLPKLYKGIEELCKIILLLERIPMYLSLIHI